MAKRVGKYKPAKPPALALRIPPEQLYALERLRDQLYRKELIAKGVIRPKA